MSDQSSEPFSAARSGRPRARSGSRTSTSGRRPSRWAEPPSFLPFFCGSRGCSTRLRATAIASRTRPMWLRLVAEPLVVVGVVVDLERHDPVADHGGVVDPGRAFLLIGGVGVALQAGVGVAGHVPGVGDPGGGPGVERGRLLGAARAWRRPRGGCGSGAPGVHRLDLEDRVDQRCRRPAGCRCRRLSRSAR